jgi:hypothetical protein
MGALATMLKTTSLVSRICVLAGLLTLLAAFPLATVSTGQSDRPQCSDGVDNDSDNAIDGTDAGCGDGSDNNEADSIYSITVPLPLVTLQGTVTRKGAVNVSKLLIRAQRGSTVDVTCKGRKCPFKRVHRIMVTSSLRLGKLERTFKPSLTLVFKIRRADQLGKYVRYRVKRKAAPVRTDSCLDQTTGKVRGCFVG